MYLEKCGRGSQDNVCTSHDYRGGGLTVKAARGGSGGALGPGRQRLSWAATEGKEAERERRPRGGIPRGTREKSRNAQSSKKTIV